MTITVTDEFIQKRIAESGGRLQVDYWGSSYAAKITFYDTLESGLLRERGSLNHTAETYLAAIRGVYEDSIDRGQIQERGE